jgi:outer membrane protein insertion porin family
MISTTTLRRRKSAMNATVAFGALAASLAVAAPVEAQQGARPAGQRAVAARTGPVINRVAFEGNSKLTRDSLQTVVLTRARTPYDQASVDADVERIREAYRQSGRGLATVQPRTVELPNGTVDVVYTITEGSKTGIQEIRFVGNQAYSAGRLRDLMTSSESNFLSFIKTNDVYDPDRIANDEELIRRYYLKNGYADFRILSTDVQFDTARGGYVITITVEEGRQYRVADVSVDSRVGGVDPDRLRRQLSTGAGDVYNAEAVERSLTAMTTEVNRQGNPFAQVRPVGQRDPATGTISLGFVVEEGPRVYIERINVRGNTRTRDYVIRRELDLGEGDPYNRVLIDRAERRLNNLGYFKRVRISNEPGSSPDRVVMNIDVEDQATGAFAVSGGYSTADGFIGEVSVTESNFLGRGQFVRIAGTAGEKSQGVDFSFTEPYFLGYRMAAGIDLFSKFSDQTQYSRYENRVTGGQLRLGLPITEEISVTLRYSLFEQDLKIPNTFKKPYNDCSAPLPEYTLLNPDGTANRTFCEGNGEASIAIKESVGRTLTSLAGVTLNYNTLDNFKSPRNGFYVEVKPDIAGLGGDSKYFRVTADARYYKEVFEDIVGIVRVQGGHISGFGGEDLRIVDHFFLGPSLVRGFAPSGIGPRDVSSGDSRSNAIGGTTYFGASAEVQFPIFGLPRDLGLKGAVFADAGTLFDYKGSRGFDVNRNGTLDCAAATALLVQPECVQVRDKNTVRSSVGASILWNSPLGPLRFDYAVALTKDKGDFNPLTGEKVGGDRTQAFRFSGGTRF